MAESPRQGLARRLLTLPYWYVTRRFATLQDHVDDRLNQLGERVENATDPNQLVEAMGQELGDIHLSLEGLERANRRPPWAELIGSSLDHLDDLSAAFLNYAGSEAGFAA